MINWNFVLSSQPVITAVILQSVFTVDVQYNSLPFIVAKDKCLTPINEYSTSSCSPSKLSLPMELSASKVFHTLRNCLLAFIIKLKITQAFYKHIFRYGKRLNVIGI